MTSTATSANARTDRQVRPAGGVAVDRAASRPTESDVESPPFRFLQVFSLVRVLVTGALVLSFVILDEPLIARDFAGADHRGWLAAAMGSYFGAASLLGLLALFVPRRFAWQLAAQLAIDVVLVTAITVAAGGLRSGLAILYLMPLTQASVLLPNVPAFFICAVIVLAMLGDSVVRALAPNARDAIVFQAGLYGAALFAMTALLRLMSARLTEQERLAVRRGRDLRDQLEVNRMVIAHMEQGVVVIDATTRVRANNVAARTLFGFAPEYQLTGQCLLDLPRLRPLALAFLSWLEADRTSGVWSERITPDLEVAEGEARSARRPIRARFSRPRSSASAEFVVFLEDARALEARAQELKLASMGRLTASIAHEIRNPLAAITQATALLAEEHPQPLRERLIGMVRDNAQRLNQLVEDVLRVARRDAPLGDDIELRPFLADWIAEFERDRPAPAGAVSIEAQDDLRVRFEYSHLRQVLFNLLDNALRYASGRPGCVQIRAERGAEPSMGARIWVFDDGPGVQLEVRDALFEPFFTTSPRGTGLGLYIAREFALANQGELQYATRREPGEPPRDGFVLTFARGDSQDEDGYFDTIAPMHHDTPQP